MYVNIVHRPKFGVIAGYANKGGSPLIYSSVVSRSPFWAEREFDAVAAMRPRVEKPAIHLVVSIAPQFHLSDYQFVGAVLWLRYVLKFDETQLMIWRHRDKAHEHIHALANRISPLGKRCDLWGKGKVIKKFQREADDFFGLSTASSSCVTHDEAEAMIVDIERIV
jgi:hypothetical protein